MPPGHKTFYLPAPPYPQLNPRHQSYYTLAPLNPHPYPGDSLANPTTIDSTMAPWHQTYYTPAPRNPQPAPAIIKVFIENSLGATQKITCRHSDTVFELKRIAGLDLSIKPEAFFVRRPRQQPLRDPYTLADQGVKDVATLELVVIYVNRKSSGRDRRSRP
ncbi:MAG: hypothetical protein Q9228_003667 [Teloschistes exilis]